MPAGRLLAIVLSAAVVVTASPALAGGDSASGSDASALKTSTGAAVGPGSSTVTLVTGDRVSFIRRGADVQVTGLVPAPDRERIGFTRYRLNGHEYVLPTDAEELVDGGTVDEALFDVSGLVALGYDDKHSTMIPVLAGGSGGDSDGLGGALLGSAPAGTEVTRSLPRLGITALDVEKDSAAAAWASLTGSGSGTAGTAGAAAERLWLNGKVTATLDESVPQIGATEAWRSGLTGKSVTVAVLDSGYDTAHPDLADRVIEAKNFTFEPSIQDQHGHGTHVSSTIAGSGAASNGRLEGAAPDVELLEARSSMPAAAARSPRFWPAWTGRSRREPTS